MRLAQLQPFESPAIEKFRAVVCPGTMVEILNREWLYLKRHGMVVEDCNVVRVFPRQAKEFVLEYELSLEHKGKKRVQRVMGELVGSEAEKHYAQLLAGLRKKRRAQIPKKLPGGKEEIPIACLPDFGLILRFSPLDEDLQGLSWALDPETMQPVLSRYLSLDNGHWTCTTDILGHRLGRRCIVRYTLQSNTPSPQPSPRIYTAIGKVYKSRANRAQEVFNAMQSLWQNGFNIQAPDHIRIPKPLACLPEWQLILMEDVPGKPMTGFETANLDTAFTETGKVIAKLHQSKLELSKKFLPEDEIRLLESWVETVSQVYPELKPLLEPALNEVQPALSSQQDFELRPAHRDFYEKQIIFDRPWTVLIDFDTLCLSEPALDLGNFLAHLKLARLQGILNSENWEEYFLAGYDPNPPLKFLKRVKTYTKSSLLRLACHHSLRPKDAHLVKPLLDLFYHV